LNGFETGYAVLLNGFDGGGGRPLPAGWVGGLFYWGKGYRCGNGVVLFKFWGGSTPIEFGFCDGRVGSGVALVVCFIPANVLGLAAGGC